MPPLKELNSIYIPFDVFELEGRKFKNTPISEILKGFINNNFSKTKWVASSNHEQFFFLSFTEFNLDLLNSFATVNMIIPFFVFDETLQNCFGYDCDFEYCFLSSSKLKDPDNRILGSFAEWDKYFIEHFPPDFSLEPRGIEYRHKDILMKYLLPAIPRSFEPLPERIVNGANWSID